MPNPSTIAQSQRKQEIIEFLDSGWSPQRIHAYLVERYGDGPQTPSAKAIQRYRRTSIDPKAMLPAKAITQALRKLSNGVVEITTIDVLIRAEEQRIAVMWYRELETGKQESTFNDAIRVITELIRLRFQIADKLGVAKTGRNKKVEIRESRALELPEESFHEFLNLLRQERAEAG